MAEIDSIPHLSMPFRVRNGSYVTVQQDSEEEAADCVRNILVFGRGSRIEDLDFGIHDPTFQVQPFDLDDISQAIADYEPRVEADIETVDLPDGTSTVSVNIAMTSIDEPEEL